MLFTETLFGTNNIGFLVGDCSVNSINNNSVSISLYDTTDSLNLVYKTTSMYNGRYILCGIKKNRTYLVIGDYIENGIKYSNTKTVKSVIDVGYLEQISYIENLKDSNYAIPINDNVAITMDLGVVSLYNNDYHGKDSLNGIFEGFSEGLDDYEVILHYNNSVYKENFTEPEFTINKIYLDGIHYISLNGKKSKFSLSLHHNVQRGYISGNVTTVDCVDSEFVIHCFRNSDKQFIGEYQLVNGKYTIDNLNLNQTYDIMLYDTLSSVETSVHSRRTPSVYQ